MNCWALRHVGQELGQFKILQHEHWKQSYEVLLFGILHIEDKIFKGIRKPGANRERFLYIAYADSGNEAVQGEVAQDGMQKIPNWTRTCVRFPAL